MLKKLVVDCLVFVCIAWTGGTVSAGTKCAECKKLWAAAEAQQCYIMICLDFIDCNQESIAGIDDHGGSAKLRAEYVDASKKERQLIKSHQRAIRRLLEKIGACRSCYPPKK